MVLVNAVYFKGNWMVEFDKNFTRPEKFHVNENNVIEVPTMVTKPIYYYGHFENLKAQYVVLHYKVHYLKFNIYLG